ncbi:16732_t:CDS:2 [Funneliformis geosporum]|nr:16732_t:CDS:2 [Funneliformis geosporum]
MTETEGQLLRELVPVCQWLPQNSPNPTSTSHIFQITLQQCPHPAGQFRINSTTAHPLRVEYDAKLRFYSNVLSPVENLLPQGIYFIETPAGFLAASDFVLCTNNYTVAKMPVEMKTRHNLNLCGCNFWEIYQDADWQETTPTTLHVSRVVQPDNDNPTLSECVYYIIQLAINDDVGNRLGHVVLDP